MSPSLEGIMFNRTANLSGRRPLLAEPQCGPRAQPVVPPRVPPRDLYITPRLVPDYPVPDPYIPNYWKPSNIELERRLQESRREYPKPDYHRTEQHHGKAVPLSLDRRDAELVFRFDPHASAEYMSSQYRAGTQVPPLPPPTPVLGRAPDPLGPFVFGVHGPGSAPLPAARRDDDYDYSEVADDRERRGDVSCCDKVNEWTSKTKKDTKTRMFQIKDRRKVKGGKKEKIKCVLVGDGAVGKSSLIAAYAQNTFSDDYTPTAHDTFNVVVDVDDRPVRVEICDTAGQDSMSELRALCYPGTDVLMLCFSVVRPETFRSVAERWTRAVANVGAPLLLVGTQSDLASDPRVLQNLKSRGEQVVSEADARALAAKINATYIETSSKTRNQLKDAFDAAILAGLPIVKRRPFWKKLFCIS